MDYRFDDVQESFRAEMRRWAEKVLAPHYQADDETAEFRPQLAMDMADMGLTSLRIPEEYGGQDASAVIAGIAAEEAGRADFNAGYLIINTALISDIIVRNATDEQKSAWLPGFPSGKTVPCICITEPGHGTDAANLEMKATPDGDGWRLHGEKTSITLGMAATHAVVLARTGGSGARGVSAFWVDMSTEGISRAPFDDLGGRSIGRASIHFEDVAVTRAELIGREGGGFVSVMQGFDYSAPSSASSASALHRSRSTRPCSGRATGRPSDNRSGSSRVVSFPLAESATYIRGARHVCYEALWLKDNDLDHSAEAAMAKFWAPKLSTEVIHQCLLTIGHLAYSTESPIGQRLRDVIGLEIGDGTAQVSKLVIARGLLGRAYAP